MLDAYKSMYVTAYNWIFKIFGQGELPRFKSLFNINFLFIIIITNALLCIQLMIKWQMIAFNIYTSAGLLAGAVCFMLINHFILLNNRWFKKLNARIAVMSKHNLNKWCITLLFNVVIACMFLIASR